METKELKVRLLKPDVDFVEAYAKAHQLSVDTVVDRSIQLLRQAASAEIHPEVRTMSGIIPAEVDAESEHKAHLLRKHRW